VTFGAEAVCQHYFTIRLANFIGDCLGIAADSNDIDLASFPQEARERIAKQAVFGQEKYTDLRGFRAVLYLSHRFFPGFLRYAVTLAGMYDRKKYRDGTE
jgi:hypothetical protein